MGKERKIKVGITHGDINGIGYEVIIKALGDEAFTELCTPIIFGHKQTLDHYNRMEGLEQPLKYTMIATPDASRDGQVNLVNITNDPVELTPGRATAEGGRLALLSLEAATQALRNRQIDVLVTAPINKEAMKLSGFPFPGHTEYLADRLGDGYKPTMILMCEEPRLRVALVSTHLPIKEVAAAVTEENVAEKIRSLHNTLRKDFGLERPKIAVLSLNPHAGDGGAIGAEERDIIAPAVEKAYGRKIMAFGPYAADGFFGSGRWRRFDAVLAMYHDQGLAPFKLVAMERGVNFTSGIPVIRTSPDHGTGYDIVGQNRADATSMREAVYAAIDILRRRLGYIRAKANPLRKQYVDRSGDRETVDLTKADPAPEGIMMEA